MPQKKDKKQIIKIKNPFKKPNKIYFKKQKKKTKKF